MEYVAHLTELLRNDPSAFWSDARAILQKHGVDPVRAALAESVEQGDDSEFAVVVTSDGEVFEFSWRPTTQDVREWIRTTAWWRDSPYRRGN
jgi:uncharacterized protein YbaA (DUF1428 family)